MSHSLQLQLQAAVGQLQRLSSTLSAVGQGQKGPLLAASATCSVGGCGHASGLLRRVGQVGRLESRDVGQLLFVRQPTGDMVVTAASLRRCAQTTNCSQTS